MRRNCTRAFFREKSWRVPLHFGPLLGPGPLEAALVPNISCGHPSLLANQRVESEGLESLTSVKSSMHGLAGWSGVNG